MLATSEDDGQPDGLLGIARGEFVLFRGEQLVARLRSHQRSTSSLAWPPTLKALVVPLDIVPVMGSICVRRSVPLREAFAFAFSVEEQRRDWRCRLGPAAQVDARGRGQQIEILLERGLLQRRKFRRVEAVPPGQSTGHTGALAVSGVVGAVKAGGMSPGCRACGGEGGAGSQAQDKRGDGRRTQ